MLERHGKAMASVNYELHTLRQGRWALDSIYAEQDREKAINEAQMMERSAYIEAVKVVKDTFDPRRGMSTETVVYSSRPRDTGEGGRYRPRRVYRPVARHRASTKKSAPVAAPRAPGTAVSTHSPWPFLVKLFAIVVVSLILASLTSTAYIRLFY